MKQIKAISGVLALLLLTNFSGISQKQTPPGLHNQHFMAIDEVILPALDMNEIEILDKEDEKNGQLYTIARSIYCDLNMENSGEWTNMQDGSRVWRLKISSKDAMALGVHFSEFYIPTGGQLFMYGEDGKKVIGPLTNSDNPPRKVYVNDFVQGESVIIEYVESNEAFENAILYISEVAYAYRDMHILFGTKDFGDSESCEVNINCPEGTNWQDEKRGVARLLTKEGINYGWCSGTLVNNTAEDCLPYVLTANHCGNASTESDFDAWRFYFNYEAEGCTSPTSEPSYDLSTGCSMIAYGSESGGSDYYLVRLNYLIPDSWNLYYNGWNRSTSATSGGVSIHHPAGDIKKISTFTSNTISSTWSGAASNAHWRVVWASTTTNHGVTEGGSSGSPLFDNNGRVIGTLTGGSSYCSNPTWPDYYGKFSYHWESNGTTDVKRLKPWLDPLNTGAVTLDGRECVASEINANFIASSTNINASESVSFTNTSAVFPSPSWSWAFEGGTPASSVSFEKTVSYANPGVYDVRLIARNISMSLTDTCLKTDYITVGGVNIENIDKLAVKIYPNPTTNRVFVESDNEINSIKIFDVNGKEFREITTSNVQGRILVDLTKLPAGLYMIKTETDNETINQRIMLVK
ncbi:MAG: T9SS type A sorting domain-containing protein [Bacteroidales bacterium]|nr:T9SS type A sorting domain-containing protein [Bacteroidales bacterium]